MTTKQSKSDKPMLDKRGIMAHTGLGKCWVERALASGKLPGHKVPDGNTKTMKWVAYVEDVDKWTAEKLVRKSPKGVLKATPAQLAELDQTLAEQGVPAEARAAIAKTLSA